MIARAIEVIDDSAMLRMQNVALRRQVAMLVCALRNKGGEFVVTDTDVQLIEGKAPQFSLELVMPPGQKHWRLIPHEVKPDLVVP